MIQPLKIFRTPNGELGIEFDDESKAVFRLRDLRLACPCALCVDENTGENAEVGVVVNGRKDAAL